MSFEESFAHEKGESETTSFERVSFLLFFFRQPLLCSTSTLLFLVPFFLVRQHDLCARAGQAGLTLASLGRAMVRDVDATVRKEMKQRETKDERRFSLLATPENEKLLLPGRPRAPPRPLVRDGARPRPGDGLHSRLRRADLNL